MRWRGVTVALTWGVAADVRGAAVVRTSRAPVVATVPAASPPYAPADPLPPRPRPALRGAVVRWHPVTVRPGRRLPLRAAPVGGPRGRVTALHPHRHALWIGTLSDGLHRLHRGRWTRVDLFDRRVSVLATGPDGALWVGTAGGLGRVDPHGLATPLRDPRGWFARHINRIVRDGSALRVMVYPGVVTVAMLHGRPAHYRYLGRDESAEFVTHDTPWSVDPVPLARASVFADLPGPDGRWLATAEGLVHLAGTRIGAFTELGGALPDRMVFDLARRNDGLWALLWRAGLARVTDGRLDVWPLPWQAQPGGLVACRGGWLLATEDRGLVRLRTRGDELEVTGWPAPPGARPGFFTAVARHGGRLWIGGTHGVAWIEDGERTLATHGG